MLLMKIARYNLYRTQHMKVLSNVISFLRNSISQDLFPEYDKKGTHIFMERMFIITLLIIVNE